jgi:hypothetical protein
VGAAYRDTLLVRIDNSTANLDSIRFDGANLLPVAQTGWATTTFTSAKLNDNPDIASRVVMNGQQYVGFCLEVEGTPTSKICPSELVIDLTGFIFLVDAPYSLSWDIIVNDPADPCVFPAVLSSAYANPNPVANGGLTKFYAEVTGGTPDSVYADLSVLGIMAPLLMTDNGTNGDDIAGDGLYTSAAQLINASVGDYFVFVRLVDVDGSQSAIGFDLSVSQGASRNEPSWANGLQVYPNPATDQLFVQLPVSGTYTAQLTNLQGQTVGTPQTLGVGQQQIVTQGLPAGIYLLGLTSQTDGTTVYRRVALR